MGCVHQSGAFKLAPAPARRGQRGQTQERAANRATGMCIGLPPHWVAPPQTTTPFQRVAGVTIECLFKQDGSMRPSVMRTVLLLVLPGGLTPLGCKPCALPRSCLRCLRCRRLFAQFHTTAESLFLASPLPCLHLRLSCRMPGGHGVLGRPCRLPFLARARAAHPRSWWAPSDLGLLRTARRDDLRACSLLLLPPGELRGADMSRQDLAKKAKPLSGPRIGGSAGLA